MSRCAALVGCGNIGSFLGPLLVRLPGIGSISLIDPDEFKPDNVAGQNLSAGDIGRPKACVAAARIRSISPDIETIAYCSRVEDLPLGALDGDLILACLDGKEARVAVNKAAWRLGVPLIDAGVNSAAGLARVDVFVPGADMPCYECGLSEADYESLDSVAACGRAAPSFPTNAHAFLGSLAASLQACEAARVLNCLDSGEPIQPVQIILGVENRQYFVSRNRRNPRCRFDHEVYSPARSGAMTLCELVGPNPEAEISVPGAEFVVGALCAGCGKRADDVLLLRSGHVPAMTCPSCDAMLVFRPDWMHSGLTESEFPPRLLSRKPEALGLQAGDLFTIRAGRESRHYLAGDGPDD